jgi:N-acetylglucosaminyldiphosphoundecaprenol N-acetyl-beta-D-mannosaminyltransferase
MKDIKTIKILDIPICFSPVKFILHLIKQKCMDNEDKNSYCISATSVHGIIESRKNPEFNQILNKFFINLPDGRPLAVVGHFKGASTMKQLTGPDFFEMVMRTTAREKINHYFCGGRKGVAERLKLECARKFLNNKVVGTFCPPFRSMSDEEIIDLASKINEHDVHILWIGLSTPKQELFAYRISKYVKIHFIITVGAAFDFHCGNLCKAPMIMRWLYLEWLYRLFLEPKRLMKRYCYIVPRFIFHAMIDIAYSKLNKYYRN